MFAPVDVTGGDLGGDDVTGFDGQLRTVVGAAPQRGELGYRASRRSDQHDLAAAAHGIRRIGRGLPIEADVLAAFLHQAVRLAGDDIRRACRTHVQRLPAPPQRQRRHIGHRGDMRRYRHRALKAADGISEGLPKLF